MAYKKRKGGKARYSRKHPCVVRPAFSHEADMALDLFDAAGITLSAVERVTTVCVKQGEVLGAAAFGRRPGSGEPTLSVVVDPSARRKGVATALTRATLRRAPKDSWNIWAVNPNMADLLERFGLDTAQRGWSPEAPHLTGTPSSYALLSKRAQKKHDAQVQARLDAARERRQPEVATKPKPPWAGVSVRKLARADAEAGLPFPRYPSSPTYMLFWRKYKGGEP